MYKHYFNARIKVERTLSKNVSHNSIFQNVFTLFLYMFNIFLLILWIMFRSMIYVVSFPQGDLAKKKIYPTLW